MLIKLAFCRAVGSFMDKFYIITNKSKDAEYSFTNEIMNYLKSMGKECQCQDFEEDVMYTKYRYTNADLIPDDIECVIVLGGDGTLIQAARDINKKNLPMFGVNLGTLGFLTATEKDTIYPALASLIKGEYEIDSRMMLQGCVYRNDELIYKNTALNDIVINRCGILRVIDFDLYVNDEYLNSYSADGVIIATSTGSTAYSLSAGGPIVQPNAELMMITPICPHTLNKRSIILGADDKIVIEMSDNKGLLEERVASFDGELFCNMITGDKIVITRAEHKASFIKTNKLSFLQIIREKMYN